MKKETPILEKDPTDIFEHMFLTPDMLRHITVDEFKKTIERENFSGSYKHIISLVERFEEKILYILEDEIDFHNYWIYTEDFIFFVYIETDVYNDHKGGPVEMDETYDMRCIPRDPTLITYTTSEETREAFHKKNNRQLRESDWWKQRQKEIAEEKKKEIEIGDVD